MKTTYSTVVAILLITALGAVSTMAASESAAAPEAAGTGGQVKEIMPGMLEGYLPKEDLLFLAAMEAAGADIDRARREGLAPKKDCAVEKAASAKMR